MIIPPASPGLFATIATKASLFASKAAKFFPAIGKILSYVGTTYYSYQIGDTAYKVCITKDDAVLIEKMTKSDCSLTKMTPRVEGCYKKYLRDALYRLAEKNGNTASDFYKIFHRCFDNRPEYNCCFWGVNVHDEM